MREVEIAPVQIEREVDYADDIRSLASDIVGSLRLALDAGDITDIEAAGRIALASVLALYADGKLPEKQSFQLLKSLAERKTPDPVVKVEQTTQIDMRVLVADIITGNAGALDRAVGRAAEARKEISARLGKTPLSLQTAAADDSQPLQLGEPDEIANIRSGRRRDENGIDWSGYREMAE